MRAWLTRSPLSPGSPFYKEAGCPWPWPWCTMKRARDMDSYVLWGRTPDIYLCSCWGRAKCNPFKSPWSPVKDSWRTGAGKGWKEKCRDKKDGRKSLANASERDQAVASQGKGFVIERAWAGLCLPARMRNCRAPLSCLCSAREEPVANGYNIAEDCAYEEIQLMKMTGGRKNKCSQCFEVQSRRKGKSSPFWPSNMSLLQSGSSFKQLSVHSLETFLSSVDGIFVLSTLSCDFTTCHISPSLSYG